MSEENLDEPAKEALSQADLEVVVELQKAELDRLLRENMRLHERVSQLLTMQEREQVLRQQMQTMLGNTAVQKQQPEESLLLEQRASTAEKRYGRLKGALTMLIDAMERQKS
ncbi:MAG: hypothetical protein ACKVH0_02925 [Alphaproteobacteria bacterium]|jgi:hypothetical protein